MATDDDDNLDIFLTLLESKLKTPFSSTEIPRTIKTLRNEKPVEYLEKVSKVLRRAEKVTQLRFLMGILGFIMEDKFSSTSFSEPTIDEDKEAIESVLRTICRNAQEAPAYEEWVRVIAGIVEKALVLQWGDDATTTKTTTTNENDHDDNNNEEDGNNPNGSKHDKEADKILNKTCKEILDRIRTVMKSTARIDEDTEHRLEQSDTDPTFAPFRYALLSPNLLERVIPDIHTNDHFTVNESADVLNLDAKLELEKAKEEAEHQKTGILAKAGNNNIHHNKNDDTAKGAQPSAVMFPGFRNSKTDTATTSPATAVAAAKQRPKSSMFMPSKRPMPATAATGATRGGMAAAGRGRLMGKNFIKPAQSTVLHQRKAGAAQALLQRGRARMLDRTGAGSSSSIKEPRSKMKMIDVAEVEGLQKKEESNASIHPPAEKPSTKPGQKRNRSEAASALERQDKRVKTNTDGTNGGRKPPPAAGTTVTSPPNHTTTTTTHNNNNNHHDNHNTSPHHHHHHHHHAGALANAALLAYQQSRSVPISNASQRSSPSQSTAGGSSTKQQDWRVLLKEHSNRLTEDDRNRIRQFFVDRTNPTPEQTVLYKMKLHEERTTDPKTGEPVKETYYLELDYSNFTSRQSKKVKRYGTAG